MTITIDLNCPHCHSPNLSRNGKKSKGNQNYLGKDCGRQFISSHELTYRGCLPEVVNLVNIMLVRGMGIRDMYHTENQHHQSLKRFLATLGGDTHLIGKKYTVGIEGNNCRMRHRIRRAFRRTCCFSKKLFNHLKTGEMAFFYINYGFA
ncbi:MAG: hypothetical protein LBL76_02425 [Treponema sp.]|jgi:transposase-like protein|nr:hypothetical protein [Treponema sp.]